MVGETLRRLVNSTHQAFVRFEINHGNMHVHYHSGLNFILILLSHSIVFNSVLSSSQILILFNTVWCFLMLKVQIVSVLSAKFCGLNQIASANGH